MDTDAFDLPEIKRAGESFLCFDIFHSLILATDIDIYLSVIINDKVLKYLVK